MKDELMINKYISLLLLLVVLSLTSCGTKKKARVEVEQPKKTVTKQVPKKKQASPQAQAKALSQKFGLRITSNDNLLLYKESSAWLGVPHRYGGNTKKGVDCSGFVSQIYREVYGKQLYRSSADMLKGNCKKLTRNSLKEGDLVFFRTDGGKKNIPNHVGIYLKSGKFIHTSTSKGVIVSSLNEPYYVRTWITGGRVK